MHQLSFTQLEYLSTLKDKLKQKRIKFLKKHMRLGALHHQAQQADTVKSIVHALKQNYRYKIDCLMELATMMIHDHLTTHPHAIIDIAKKLLKNVAAHADIEILAHPQDALTIKSHLNELATAAGRKITIIEDPTLSLGSLLLQANKSIIDAKIENQLEKAREIFLQ